MSEFVLELGFESGEGEFRQWESQGFYQGYTDKGPVIVSDVDEAFKFASVERASWMPAGDARLRASRIKPLDFYE